MGEYFEYLGHVVVVEGAQAVVATGKPGHHRGRDCREAAEAEVLELRPACLNRGEGRLLELYGQWNH